MKVAISQSNYLPWKGYFDLINDVDLFVFYDDAQFTYRDWRNRNKIKVNDGVRWLTVPVGNRTDQKICDVKITQSHWQKKHWKSLLWSYKEAPFIGMFKAYFENVYLHQTWNNLSQLNQVLTKHIAEEYLGIRTEFTTSMTLGKVGTKQDALINMLKKCGATTYITGPSARSYIDPSVFSDAGIGLVWKDYSHYPEYPQLHPPFKHDVTILDLLFQTGPSAKNYIWGA